MSSASSTAETFITVLGWVLIVFTGFGLVTSVMQNVMVFFMLPALDSQVPEVQQVPRSALLTFRTIAAFMLCVAAFLLFSAWSFLRRRNWARKTFVVLFTLGAVWSGFVFLVFGLGLGVFNYLPQSPSPEVPSSVDSMFRFMGIMFGALAAAFAVLFGWLIRRLRSADVRAEFHAQPLSSESLQDGTRV
jgi:uncharacterized membrane protein YozB (DUF420 family)